MGEKTLKLGDIVVNIKEFNVSKKTSCFKFSGHKFNSNIW